MTGFVKAAPDSGRIKARNRVAEFPLGGGGLTWLVIATLWSSLTIWFIIWFMASATTPIEVEPKKMILPLLAFFWMPVSFGMSDYRRGEQKREALDSLHPAFHARFPVSEILSIGRLVSPLRWRSAIGPVAMSMLRLLR